MEREQQLCALLDQMKQDAAMVVFLGDMFDFWFTYRYVVPRGHIRLLGRMAELADAGIKLHFFIGNHDMWLFDYLSSQMPITMHDDPAILLFDGKKFLVGHGDGRVAEAAKAISRRTLISSNTKATTAKASCSIVKSVYP